MESLGSKKQGVGWTGHCPEIWDILKSWTGLTGCTGYFHYFPLLAGQAEETVKVISPPAKVIKIFTRIDK